MSKQNKYVKKFYMLLILIFIIMVVGCTTNNNKEENFTLMQVNALKTEYIQYEEALDYKGFIVAKDTSRLSFEQPGTIKNIAVERGQKIFRGDILAELNTFNTEMALDNAIQNTLLAQNSYQQIENRIFTLLLGIEAEKLNLENIEGAYEVEKLNLENAIASYDAEKINLANAVSMYEAEHLNLKSIEDTYDSNLKLIKLSYESVKTSYDRARQLYDLGYLTRQNYDDAKYAYDSVVTELNAAETSKNNALSIQKRNIESLENNIELQNINIKTMENNIELQKINIMTIKNNIELQRNSIRALENDLQLAYIQLEAANLGEAQARIGIQQLDRQITDSKIISPLDGYVVDILAHQGEVTGSGVPVIVIQSEHKVVEIGVSMEDYASIYIGMPVIIESLGESYSGVISTIAQTPDEGSRTYNVEIISQDINLPTGSLVNVKLITNTEKGVFIPIESVINIGGVNYIYILNEEPLVNSYTTVKTEINLGTVKGEKVLASNLTENILFVSEGVTNLRENISVNITL